MILQWFFSRPWLPGLVRRFGWIAVCALAAIYLNGFRGGFQPFGPLFIWLLDRTWLFFALVVVLALSGIILDKLEWQGVIELRGGEGHRWARSLRARLGLVVYMPVILVLSWGLLDFAQRAWFAADWGRFAVAAFFTIDFLLMALAGLAMALSARRILAIEADGVRVGDRLLPFAAVERVRVTGDLQNREVALIAEGHERWLDLEQTGVSVRTFVERLTGMAPQLPVDWPGRR